MQNTRQILRFPLTFLVLFLLPVISWSGVTTEDTKEYSYKKVPNDPLNARIYKLDNGLTVYLTVYKDEPRIQTLVAVRAGSKNDPSDATGLAHYLEHMVFKGNSKIGTWSWEEEKVLLEQISDLYEAHRNTTDEVKRKSIYLKIDSLSGEAAKFAIANEYDKMISSIGAKGTNAYTWVEQTVYVNDIPSNELEKWMMVESARFQELVLRLFHTELEAVYEEFNRGQDSDFRKIYKVLNESLFKKHPYGTQTTIGTGEHLKNPSMEKIHQYFDTYYKPNNIAICLSGDLDPDKTIAMIDKYFGNWKPGDIPEFSFEKEDPITAPIEQDVYGSQEERVVLGYRVNGGAGSKEALKLELMDMILMNGQAGLLDINLNQQQKVIDLSTSPTIMTDYSTFMIQARPREGQSKEEVKNLILGELEKLKKGEFDEWLMEAAINQLRLQQTKSYEQNWARASAFVEAYITRQKWEDVVKHFDQMEKITKAELVEFANKVLKDNYVAIYKHVGEDKSLHKVEKPQITPVTVNREKQSEFMQSFEQMQSGSLSPKFIDFQKDITNLKTASGIPVHYIKNNDNKTFELHYILDMGKDNDKMLAIVTQYLPLIGTEFMTAEQVQQEFFKLGLRFDVYSNKDNVYISLSGLEKSIEPGIGLMEQLIAAPKPDEDAMEKMVAGILKKRQDAKLNKQAILRGGMVNFAKYGEDNSFTNIVSEEELKQLSPEILTNKIKELTTYKHHILYFGSNPSSKVVEMMDKMHKTPSTLKDYPEAKKFPEIPLDEKIVYFVNYDMVQAEVMMLSKSEKYNKDWEPYIKIYNQYFGSGLSSIVFQEIREAKALAYSAFASLRLPDYADESHYYLTYVGTQSDKLSDALTTMNDIVHNMPVAEEQYNAAKDALLKQIESERITKADIYWTYESALKRGLDYDIRKDIYTKLKDIDITDLEKFQQENVKGSNFIYLVLGSKENLNLEALKKLGTLKELTLEEIFNY